MEKITYTIKNNNINVAVPFSLKDNFKKHFKCSWDSLFKKWTISLEDEQKLITYIKHVEKSGIIEAFKNKEEVQKKNDDLSSVAKELETIKSEIKKNVSSAKTDEQIAIEKRELLAQIEEARTKLKEVKELARQAKETKQQKQKEVEELVASVVDLDVVKKAHATMVANYKKVYSENKDKYLEASAQILCELKKLRIVGFNSPALADLGTMNWNRKDRDNPNDWVYAEYFEIEKYEA